MSIPRSVPTGSRIRPLAVSVLLATVAWNEARAIDVSGVYANSGTVVAADPGPAAGAVSLQGLLGLEFDLALANALHSQTSRVEVRQTASIFRMVCKDVDGVVTWSGQWKMGEGYGVEEGQVNLIFRSKRFENDGFQFALSMASGDNLLLVDVRRVTSTWFGPVVKPIGVFLFSRLPTD